MNSDISLKSRSGTLDAFVTSSRPLPEPVATSQEIRDRGSIFIANIYHATTPEEAKARVNHLKEYVHGQKPATHEISAWRCMVVRQGKTGLGGPEDFELKSGSKDDGESWAGGKVLKVMQDQAVIDAVVVVSRWYGGTMLGPARFSHIETCAVEVCRSFKRSEELRECISMLGTLDDVLIELRKELAQSKDDLSKSSTLNGESTLLKQANHDYSTLDLTKAKRLVQARENAIKSVKSLLAKRMNS